MSSSGPINRSVPPSGMDRSGAASERDPVAARQWPEQVRETFTGLMSPRRLVPVLVVGASLLFAQARFSGSAASNIVAVAMSFSFWVVAPLSWRILLADDRGAARNALNAVLYLGCAASVLLISGPLLTRLLALDGTFLTNPTSLIVCGALFIVGGWGLGRDIELEANLARERARADQLAVEAEHAQLLALRSHLDPHFLFNTLNAIAEWCRQDGEVAERAVLELASMLRTILGGVRRSGWPLTQELELVRTLFGLHRLRDPGRFQVQLEVPSDLPAIEVPPLILLPLAENAVKHGPAAGHRGDVRLRVVTEADRIRIELENPGPYAGPRPGSDGLPTLQRRLALAYGGAASLELKGEGAQTRAVLILPRTARSVEESP